MKIKIKSPSGFSLVELLVAVALTALVMVGISAFFSNSFQIMFRARQGLAETLNELVFSTNLQKQFLQTDSLHEMAQNGKSAVFKNRFQPIPLSFSFLGESSQRLGLKNFIVFNGQEGNKASSEFFGSVSNPAGIAQLNGIYYVAAPLENAIYSCSNTCTQKLAVDGLKLPMDVTTDGSRLFVSDAGNNRIVQIANVGTSNDLTVIATGFDFPTGLEYYSAGKGFLFVSDTNHHQVKRIQIDGGETEAIVGVGTNAACNGSAQYCALNYPTGLVLGDDGSGLSLYIADTGNGRILRVSKPALISEFEVPFTTSKEPAAIREVKLTFPKGTKLQNPNAVISSDGGYLRETGDQVVADNTFTYRLWTKLISDTQEVNTCEPEPCSPSKNKIEVEKPQLFGNQFNTLKLGDDANNNLTVSSKSGFLLKLGNNFATHHPAETEVSLATPVPANTNIDFKFSNVDVSAVSAGIHSVLIQMQNEEGKFLASAKAFFRFPGEFLGMPDDYISVYADKIPFPTGLGWSGNTPIYAQTAVYPPEFTDFDYLTDTPVKNVVFSSVDEGKFLKLTFQVVQNPNTENESIMDRILYVGLNS